MGTIESRLERRQRWLYENGRPSDLRELAAWLVAQEAPARATRDQLRKERSAAKRGSGIPTERHRTMDANTVRVEERAAKAQKLDILSITVVTCTANDAHNYATIRGRMNGGPVQTFQGYGIGPIDAMCRALDHFEPGFVVLRWEGKAEGIGSDAFGIIEVSIRCVDGKLYHGTARHRNVMQATALAIADALNRHFFHLYKYPRAR